MTVCGTTHRAMHTPLPASPLLPCAATQATGRCNAVPFSMRFFLLLPFMHQEDLATQEEGVVLFTVEVERAKAVEGAEGHVSSLENGRKFMAAHRDVIKQWGRFPHRNATLGRQSTPDEDQGLKDGSIAKF